MQSFFERRDPWGHGLARYVLLFLVLLLPALVLGGRFIHFENDVRDWLPADDQDARILEWHDDHFQRYDTFLVSWDDSALNDPRVEELRQRLEGVPDEDGNLTGGLPGVQGVTSPRELVERMTEGGIEPAQAIEQLNGVLVGTGFLKFRLTEAGRGRQEEVERQLVEFVDREFDLTATVLPPVPESADPAEANHSDDPDVASETIPPPPAHDFQLRWPGIHPGASQVAPIREFAETLEADGRRLVEECFFRAGSPVALFVRITPEDSDDLAELFAAVRAAARDVGIDDSEFHMAGTPVGQLQLDVESKKSLWNRDVPLWWIHKRSPTFLSGLVGMVVALLLLRSMRLAALVLFVSAYTAYACVLLVPLTGRTLNIVVAVMPNLLLVLSASGVIHVANYWRHASQRGSENAIADAVKVARKPCAMASVTTAIGMASLLVSSLVPVREFGMYSALGVMLSLLMILYGFPSVLAVLGGLPKRFKTMDDSHWRRYGMFVARHHLAWTAAFALIFAGGVYGLRYFHTETKVIRYFREDTRIVEDYNAIEESLAGVVTVDTVVYFDRSARDRLDVLERIEIVRAVEDSIRDAEGVSGTLSLADFRAPTTPPAEDASTAARIRYRARVRRTEQVLFEEDSDSNQLVCRVESPLTFTRAGRTVRFDPGIDEDDPDADREDANEVWQIRAQSAMMTDLDYGDLVKDLNQRAAAAVAAATADDLEVDAEDAGVNYVVTGMVPLFLRTQNAVIESLIISFGLAFVAIAVTMILLLRSVTSGLLSMIPNVWPSVIVFGAISLCGVPIDIGTMITASVAMGIAVDGTVHLLTWFRDGILAGHDRNEAMARALAHCGPALWQTTGTIALAMLMAIFADLLLMSRFGWIMSAAVTAALVADVALTPALLAGPLGGLIERALKRQRERLDADSKSQGAALAEQGR